MQDDNVSDQFMGMGLNAGTQSSKKMLEEFSKFMTLVCGKR